jgi:hypothetical protein
MSAAPRVSAHAQDCGQPQFMSIPFTKGESRVVARDFEGRVYAELGDCWWRGGGECEI